MQRLKLRTAQHLPTPSRPALAQPAPAARTLNLRDAIVAALDALKAQNLVVIDLDGKASFADLMIIATGTSSRHVAALADAATEAMAKSHSRPLGVEGLPAADWVCVDDGDIVVHLFTPATRTHYNLEKLWSHRFPTVE